MVKYVPKEQQIVEAIRMIGFKQDGAEYFNLHDFAKFMNGEIVRLNMSSDEACTTTISVTRGGNSTPLHVRAGEYLVRFPDGNLTIMTSDLFDKKYRQMKIAEQEEPKPEPTKQEPVHNNSNCPLEFFTYGQVIGKYKVNGLTISSLVQWLNNKTKKPVFNWYQVGDMYVLVMLVPAYLQHVPENTKALELKEFQSIVLNKFSLGVHGTQVGYYSVVDTYQNKTLSQHMDRPSAEAALTAYRDGYLALWHTYRNFLNKGVGL